MNILKLIQKAKPSKYRNERSTGFDSKAEFRRWQELCILEKAGEIRSLRCQVPYILQEKTGKIRAIKLVVDFEYIDSGSGKVVVEDVKGVRTQVYRIKKKLFDVKYPNVIFKEIKV